MTVRRADTEIVGEFSSRVLAVNLIVYSDCVERELVADGRVRRDVVQLRDVQELKLEPLTSELVNLVIRGPGGRRIQMEMMDRTSAKRARDLLERLTASNGLG
jgi:hypothetical protein